MQPEKNKPGHNPKGRKGKLNKAMQEKLSAKITNGNTYKNACLLCGIGETTFYEWMAKGQQGQDEGKKNKYTEFAEIIKKAMAEAENRNLLIIQKVAQEEREWQAAAWFLERRNPEAWGRKQALHHTIEEKIDNKKLRNNVMEALKDEGKQKVYDELLERLGTRGITSISEE